MLTRTHPHPTQQGAPPKSLTFYQAPDGCLHAVFALDNEKAEGSSGVQDEDGGEGAAAAAAAACFPVYSRGVAPRAPMPVVRMDASGSYEPLAALASRLCVNR